MRYYYTDPLKAAFMSEKFGFKYKGFDGVELTWCRRFFCYLHPNEKTSTRWDDKFYIQQDSLRLLEPMVGDLTEFGNVGRVSDDNIELLKGRTFSQIPKSIIKILQRNGECFFWPDCEK